MKKVVLYGKHRKLPFFVGTETECEAWILRHSNIHEYYRVLHFPDGNAYDVGYSFMYQIVNADEGETEGIEQNQ